MARAQGFFDRGDRQGRPDPVVRPQRPRRQARRAFDRGRRRNRRQERLSPVRRDEGRADQGRAALTTPSRGDNGKAGDAKTPGTTVANTAQQAYFADVASKVVLPMLKARNKPFVLVFWSRDPDGTQHNQGDSLNTVTPGHQRPSTMASIKNADNNLAQLRKTLDELGLSATTNIIVSADHGFSTISKESKTSPSAKVSYDDTPKDFLPMGFLALDLAKALDLPLFDPNDKNAPVAGNAHPKAGNGVLGKDPASPTSWWRPMADRTWSICEQGQEARRPHDQGPARTGTMSADCSSTMHS